MQIDSPSFKLKKFKSMTFLIIDSVFRVKRKLECCNEVSFEMLSAPKGQKDLLLVHLDLRSSSD